MERMSIHAVRVARKPTSPLYRRGITRYHTTPIYSHTSVHPSIHPLIHPSIKSTPLPFPSHFNFQVPNLPSSPLLHPSIHFTCHPDSPLSNHPLPPSSIKPHIYTSHGKFRQEEHETRVRYHAHDLAVYCTGRCADPRAPDQRSQNEGPFFRPGLSLMVVRRDKIHYT
jgi:hypothetical protein